MPTNLEQTILRNLLTDEEYMRKVLPFINLITFKVYTEYCLEKLVSLLQNIINYQLLNHFKLNLINTAFKV